VGRRAGARRRQDALVGRVIGRVYRGGKVGGLVRYLYGPGRHNEHQNPHLVASWSGCARRELAVVEPEWAGVGERDYRGLVAELEAPARYAERGERNPVWHCPLRTAPADRVLTDGEWAEVAVDLMHRTGIAPRGDDGGCRWVAVRHDEVSIHLVAVLARQDGARAHPANDWHQVRATCLAAEARYGLQVTAPADKTAARHTSRAETEKATRSGQVVPARDWLRGQVQYAAAGAREPAAFLDRLRVAGVVVRERREPDGRLSGYAVGRPEPVGETVLFGGGKLAADLSLPKLLARWHATGDGDEAAEPVAAVVEPAARAALWEQASAAAAQAAEDVRLLIDSATEGASVDSGDAAAAVAEVLVAAGRLIEGDADGPLTQAVRDYDRAARESRGRPVTGTVAGSALRAAALQMAQGGRRPGRSEAAQVALLVAQIGRLSVSIARLRGAQDRQAQAAAARRAARAIGQANDHWTNQGHAAAAELEQRRLASTSSKGASTTTTAARRPPPNGREPRGRGR